MKVVVGVISPAAMPVLDLSNVIISPHISGAMQDYWTPIVALFSENLRRFEHGEPLLNVVDEMAGYYGQDGQDGQDG